MSTSPSKWAIRFLKIVCPDHLFEEIEGDLLQKFYKDVKIFGGQRARRRFAWNAMQYARPGIVMRNKFTTQLINTIMVRNYFKISVRNIFHNPLHSWINMFSLAVGLAACFVIYLFINDEKSFDTFHSKGANIYRIYSGPNSAGTDIKKVALTMGWIAPELIREFPEVAGYTRYWNRGNQIFRSEEETIVINSVAAVDSTFLTIFDFPLVYGDRNTALNEPNSILLTKETASKLFDVLPDAVEKSITIEGVEFKITGILNDLPENSHLKFDALQSISTFSRTDRFFRPTWDGSFLNTYLLLYPHSNPGKIEAAFADFLIKHGKEPSKNPTIHLQPLADIHLQSSDIEHDYNNYRKFNGDYLNVFVVVGIFVLLIACVNFMNLTFARASYRWKEAGVRSAVGARKIQIFGQFIFESVLLALFSLGLAILLDFFLLPLLNQSIGRQLLLTSFLNSPYELIFILLTTVLLGLLTGLYPSFYMTSFNVVAALKGGIKIQGKSIFRSSLIVGQFILAIAMIESTLIVMKQISFMRNSDSGFTSHQIMLIGMNAEVNKKFETLKTEWLRKGYVTGVTASGQRLGNNLNAWGFKVKMDTGVYHFSPSNVNVDYDYLNVYGMVVKEGRTFSKNFATDQGRSFIINETMVKELGLKDPIGMAAGHAWYENDSLGTVIGVVKDFNYNSLHHKINPVALVCHPEWGYSEISIKINGAHAQQAIAEVREVWEKTISSYPFTYFFLDEHFATLYRSDQQMSVVITLMTVLAIVISCVGLFGLVAITTRKKIKEIGIRKTMGASEIQIVMMLSKFFATLIAVAFILASPLTYYLLSGWLQNFAYRIQVGPLLFVLGGLIALIITLLTISYHTLKAARENPVKSLRYE